MKKVIFPLAFSVLLGLTTHHALCMKEELETKETLLKKFKEVKNEYESENKKNNELKIKFIENCNLTHRASSTDGILTIYPLPQPGTDDDLIASDNELFRLSSEKEKIEEKLKIELNKLKIARKKETEINTELSIRQPKRFDNKNRPIYGRGLIIDGDDTYEHLRESSTRLSEIVSEIERIEKILGLK